MKEFLQFYWPNILATVTAATILPNFGAHWIARNEGAKAVMLSQVAGFGVLIGLLVKLLFSLEESSLWLTLPTALGILLSFGGSWLLQLFPQTDSIKTALFLSIFFFFWSLSQAILGLFPGLEAHHSSLYFGDVVTLSKSESLYFFTGTLVSGTYYLWNHRKLVERTFELSILGYPLKILSRKDGIFLFVALLGLVFSIQFLGVLFTLSCFLIPSTLIGFFRVSGIKLHFLLASFIGFFAAIAGFFWSMVDPRLLTTPTIVIFLVGLPLGGKMLFTAIYRCK